MPHIKQRFAPENKIRHLIADSIFGLPASLGKNLKLHLISFEMIIKKNNWVAHLVLDLFFNWMSMTKYQTMLSLFKSPYLSGVSCTLSPHWAVLDTIPPLGHFLLFLFYFIFVFWKPQTPPVFFTLSLMTTVSTHTLFSFPIRKWAIAWRSGAQAKEILWHPTSPEVQNFQGTREPPQEYRMCCSRGSFCISKRM